LACSAAIVAAATLGPKIPYYGGLGALPHGHDGVNLQTGSASEARVEEFLEHWGWRLIDISPITQDGYFEALRWNTPSCAASAFVAIVVRNNENALLIQRELVRNGSTIFYVYDGEIHDRPVRFAYVRDGLGVILRSTGLVSYRVPIYVAVVQPPGCDLRAAVPWSTL
jgi:hypothetical protein